MTTGVSVEINCINNWHNGGLRSMRGISRQPGNNGSQDVHTHTQGGVVQACAFNVIKNPTHTCSLYIRVSFRITMKTDKGKV